jgi:hypothetical protein
MVQEKQNTILVIDDDPDIILFLQFLLDLLLSGEDLVMRR